MLGKYGCVGSLRLSLDFLFSRDVSDLPTMSEAVIASYLLDQPVLFKRFTKYMVLNSDQPFTSLAMSDHGQMIPTQVWCSYLLRYALCICFKTFC